MNEKTLKEGYYYEEIPVYDKLPSKLPKAPKYEIEVFSKTMSHREILKEYDVKPYESFKEAASVVVDIIPKIENYKSRIVYFNYEGKLFRFRAWRLGDGRLGVSVREVRLGDECGPESGVCFQSNNSLIPLKFDTLNFESFDARLKKIENLVENITKAWNAYHE